jgi:hypothetical protein
MLKIDENSALGLAVIIGFGVSLAKGNAGLSLIWLLSMAILIPAIYMIVGRSSLTTTGQWAVISGFILAITGIFFLL